MPKIKNIDKAARCLKRAIKNNENIVLFSDSDLDGTTSLIILEQAIKSLGGKISARFFPDREKEGYGLTKEGLNALKKYAPAVLVLSDCGIASFKEIARAQKIGFEVIVIEHHEILDKLPPARVVIDPKQKGDKHCFKFLAACGICLNLAQQLLKKDISPAMEKDFFILAALGTIADMMPQKEDNKIIIKKGLEYFPFSFRQGLRIFFELYPGLSLREIVQKIISLLQITRIRNHLTESYIFLNSSDKKELNKMMRGLLAEQGKRRLLLNKFLEQMEKKNLSGGPEFIIEGNREIPISLTGALASKIYAKFRKPSFIFGYKGSLVRGSARAGKEINTVEALKNCSSLLETFGGHPPASGFSLKKENLEEFEECLKNHFESNT